MKKENKIWLCALAIVLSCAAAVLGFWLMSWMWDDLSRIQRVLFGTLFSVTPFSVILAISCLCRKK